MAKEATVPEKGQPAGQDAGTKQGFPMKKMITIGIPVFLVQIVLIFFVIKMFIAPSSPAAPAGHGEAAEPAKKSGGEHGEGTVQTLFVVKDLIVNPAGTNGTRFLLTTVGFEVSSPDAQKELEGKEVQVRDVLNTVLTSKGLDELVDVRQREALRTEIMEKINALLKSGSLSSVYFSKFIIQ
jgi:flagellar basal body-associated protein FliL